MKKEEFLDYFLNVPISINNLYRAFCAYRLIENLKHLQSIQNEALRLNN